MITFTPTPPGQPYAGHNVTVTAPIGNFKVGDSLNIKIAAMSGKRYKPGKDRLGKWIDTEGVPEDRYMIYAPASYYAVGTKEDIDKCFDEHRIN